MLASVLKLVFGSKSGRDVRRMRPLIKKINEFEVEYQSFSELELQAKTQEFKDRFQKGETLDELLCEAFAVVKNACRRLSGSEYNVCGRPVRWEMVPYDVQLIGGVVLHRGHIAEMATGEGKTLVATLPLYLNALTGKNVQLVTVNDYLARRDSEWMGHLYKYLGLTVGCIQSQMPPDIRRQMYLCDITYGTNAEFGFDYLRDMGMANDPRQLVQRDHFFAIVDEVDSILIDEARTPLIISGPVAVSTHQYDKLKPGVERLFQAQFTLCSRLVREARDTIANAEKESSEAIEEAILKLVQVKMGMPQHKQFMHMLEDGEVLKRVEKAEMNVRSDQNRGMLQEVQAELFFSVDVRNHEADLTEKGRQMISPNNPDAFVLPDLILTIEDIERDKSLTEEEKITRKDDFREVFAEKSETLQNISQLLKAYCLFQKDIHYIVQENKVIIVDEHTGRPMPGRRFSDGLHQALEAKENVVIERETQTMATITIQNYFRLYEKLAGMTGTAETEATEFHQIYKLDVTVIPTNRPCVRRDVNDSVYKSKREKFKAIIDEVEERNKTGQPILLGTISVEDSEILSRFLKQRNIPHNVLNAKEHDREAEIISLAGQKGSVTVATNMAGRGTDIKLGDGVAELGGLHVIGSSRHDSRRIDRQLRGRCSRQGDPGSSHFYVSLEDSLMRLFGSDRIIAVIDRFGGGLPENEEIQHPFLNKSIETAQRRVEQSHFSIRKRTLEFDDVMNKHREVIYAFRKEGLFTDTPREIIYDVLSEELEKRVGEFFVTGIAKNENTIDLKPVLAWISTTFPLTVSPAEINAFRLESGTYDLNGIHLFLFNTVREAYEAKVAQGDPDQLVYMERSIILEAVDRLWQEHLHAMDLLRSSINLRVYAQKDPLIEYKSEAYEMFVRLMRDIYHDVLRNMFRSTVSISAFEQILSQLPKELVHKLLDQYEDADTVNAERKEQKKLKNQK